MRPPLGRRPFQGGEHATERVGSGQVRTPVEGLGQPIPPQAGKAGNGLPRIGTAAGAPPGVKTDHGETITFKVSEQFLKDLPDPLRIHGKGKFADLKKDVRIDVDYHREGGTTDVCDGVNIKYWVVEGVVQDKYEDAFVVRDDQKKLFAFNAGDKLRKGEDDKTRDTFTDKLADLKKGRRVRQLYFKDKEARVCTGLKFVK